jgi:hypothetical protein
MTTRELKLATEVASETEKGVVQLAPDGDTTARLAVQGSDARLTAAADLAAHLADTADAHDASAISVVPAGAIAATDVQAALAELDSEKAAASHTHTASQVTDFTEASQDVIGAMVVAAGGTYDDPGGTITLPGGAPSGAAGGVLAGTYPNPSFAADMATQAELDAHIGDTTAAHAASAIAFTPNGSIAATDVQAAIQEVRDEAASGSFQPLDSDLTDIAALSPANDDMIQRKAGAWTNRTIAQLVADLIAAGSFTEGVQDVIGAMVAAAGGSYNDGANTITLPTGGTLNIQELDGTPSGAFGTLKLPNGTLTDNGDGSATYTPAVAAAAHPSAQPSSWRRPVSEEAPMAANTAPIFVKNSYVARARVAAANTNHDGSGTLVDLDHRHDRGHARRARLRYAAEVTTTAGMLRIWHYDGTDSRLLAEIPIPANTVSASNPGVAGNGRAATGSR